MLMDQMFMVVSMKMIVNSKMDQDYSKLKMPSHTDMMQVCKSLLDSETQLTIGETSDLSLALTK
jgi:hypothetical protein